MPPGCQVRTLSTRQQKQCASRNYLITELIPQHIQSFSIIFFGSIFFLFNFNCLHVSSLRNEDNMELQEVKPINLLTISNRLTNHPLTNKTLNQSNTLDLH